jgi:hypothetical protein
MSSTAPFIGLKYGWSATTENFASDMDLNLKTLDALLQLTVQAKTVSDPTTISPVAGQAWIVKAGAVGVWAGQDNNIAAYIAGSWVFIAAKVGMKAYIVAEDATAIYKGSPTPAWTNNPNGGGSINNGENLGAGTAIFAAIDGDKLSFKSLVQGAGMSLSSDANTITLASVDSGGVVPLNSQTATAYTLAATDVGQCVEMNNAAANAVTVPANSLVAFGIGSSIIIRQMGAGATSIVAASGVTIRNPHGTLKLRAQYSSVSLHKRGTDEWCIEGALSEI